MSEFLTQYFEGKIVSLYVRPLLLRPTTCTRVCHYQDFEGQKLVEQISRNTLIVASVSRTRLASCECCEV